MLKTNIIAEAGVNHNGDLNLAFELIDAASAGGADYVKFQTYSASEVASSHVNKAPYQIKNTNENESQLEMLRRLQISRDDHLRLTEYCELRNVKFLTTTCDIPSLKFVTGELGCNLIKLGSAELTNGPLLLAAGMSDVDIILSTGMATLREIEEALSLIAFGSIYKKEPKYKKEYLDCLRYEQSWTSIRKKVALMHCTTEYPAKFSDTNLRVIDTLIKSFGLPVGYSDHTVGSTMAIGAIVMGATLLEKHITVSRLLPGPDHSSSMEPDEFSQFVKDIRNIESGIGSGIRIPSADEVKNIPNVRKCLVANRALSAGEVLGHEHISSKRHSDGITPMDYWDILGRTLKQNVGTGQAITLEDLL